MEIKRRYVRAGTTTTLSEGASGSPQRPLNTAGSEEHFKVSPERTKPAPLAEESKEKLEQESDALLERMEEAQEISYELP